jgi:hypothetical protein
MVYDKLKSAGNLEASLWLTCAEVGVPFIKEIYVKVDNEARSTDSRVRKSIIDKKYKYFGKYLQYLNAKKTKGKKWDSFDNTDVPLGEIETMTKSEEALKLEAKKFELNWGEQSVEDYQYLEYRFDIYTKDIPLTVAQDSLYRQLCLVELAKRKKEATNDSTKEEQTQILSLMKTLKIDNFSEVRDKSLAEQMIETQIALHERTEPFEFYDDKELYRDQCGLGEYWNKHILRCMKNLLAGNKEYPKLIKE